MENDDISNLINKFKNILDNGKLNNTISNSSNNELNITPEMIYNLKKEFQNKNVENKEKSTSSTNNITNGNISNSIDIDTILKIKSVIETLNQNDDRRSNLLYSIKPYLRESRQKKIDQYANLLKITKLSTLFKNEKGDSN